MKKIISTILIITVVVTSFMLTGCNKKDTKTGYKLKVVATMFAGYDFARQIGQDNIDLTMLLAPGAEAHTYEPTPKEIIKIKECDVFIYVGGENDEWVNDILDSVDNKDMKIIKMLDCVTAYEEETVEGMEEEHEEEPVDEGEVEWDEHVWTSPVNAKAISKVIATTFEDKDEANKQTYEDNFDVYNKLLDELDTEFKDIVKNAKRKTVVFGDRFPLRYFVEEYGLKYFAAFPGCAEQTEANASTLAFLINKVKDEKIPVVFKIELSNGNIAETIAEDTGAKILTFYTCHNLSKEDFDNGMTYVDYMKKNIETLKEALN